MTWNPGYAGFAGGRDGDAQLRIDYSCVFGTTRPAVRHDPHVHDQMEMMGADLLTIADLIRDKGTA